MQIMNLMQIWSKFIISTCQIHWENEPTGEVWSGTQPAPIRPDPQPEIHDPNAYVVE